MAKSSNNVTRPTDADVLAFLKTVEHPVRRADADTAIEIFSRVTGEPPVMWGPSIIGFGQYHYRYESGREGDMCVVGFSPRKANIVCYVMGQLGPEEPLLKTLGKHRIGKGSCLYINKLADVDLTVLAQMIEKSWRLTLEKYAQS